MTQDNAVVQGTVPPAETVSPAEPPREEILLPPSPEEALQKRIAEEVTKEVAKAIALETEKARRELQSTKDKAMAEVNAAQRRARFAESTLTTTRSHLQTLDPEVAKELELAELRAKEQSRQTMEQEEQAAQYQASIVQGFQDKMTQFVVGLGLNPADPRIDWAGDAPDLLTRMERIQGSVVKVQKENIKALETNIDVKIKEAEKRIKKELGGEDVNSVSTQMSGGVSGKGIPTDMSKFRDWVGKLPMAEYEKLKPDIEKAMAAGLIK